MLPYSPLIGQTLALKAPRARIIFGIVCSSFSYTTTYTWKDRANCPICILVPSHPDMLAVKPYTLGRLLL